MQQGAGQLVRIVISYLTLFVVGVAAFAVVAHQTTNWRDHIYWDSDIEKWRPVTHSTSATLATLLYKAVPASTVLAGSLLLHFLRRSKAIAVTDD